MNRTGGYNLQAKKSLSPSKPKPKVVNSHNILFNNLYFCHYRNAMYMGPTRNFKKDGRGILIHDNGMNLVSNYSNDLLQGHNIFFNQHCLVSA